jgi:hypothetical protein
MDLSQSSEQWSKAHLAVNDILNQLLNQLRDLGYNPSYHISYDRKEQHLIIDSVLLEKHGALKQLFDEYVQACIARDTAVEKIQEAPKVDLGF